MILMKKEEGIYLAIVLTAVLIILTVAFTNFKSTGFAVFEEYDNQSACEAAGYTWENITEENCTNITICINETSDCEPCLEYEDINGTQGDCINWSSCINETCTDEENCTEIVTGEQCMGDVCDSEHLDLCLDETNCTDAQGYWYNDICNAEEQCIPDCSGKECGDDSCGGSCGSCDSEYTCSSGTCEKESETEEESETQEKESAETTPTSVPITRLSAEDIQTTSLNPGSLQEFKWKVKNAGDIFLRNCTVKTSGNLSSWIVPSNETKNLKVGEEEEFVFNVLVPEDSEEKGYTLSISLRCSQTFVAKEFSIDVVEKKLELNITSADRIRGNRVRVLYSLEELSGTDQDVVMYFSLLNSEDQEIAKVNENRSIKANSTREFRTLIPFNDSIEEVNGSIEEEELNLLVNFNSQIYSSSVQEPIVLGAPIGGFAVFEGIGAGSIAILVIVVLALAITLFVLRRMRKKHRSE